MMMVRPGQHCDITPMVVPIDEILGVGPGRGTNQIAGRITVPTSTNLSPVAIFESSIPDVIMGKPGTWGEAVNALPLKTNQPAIMDIYGIARELQCSTNGEILSRGFVAAGGDQLRWRSDLGPNNWITIKMCMIHMSN